MYHAQRPAVECARRAEHSEPELVVQAEAHDGRGRVALAGLALGLWSGAGLQTGWEYAL